MSFVIALIPAVGAFYFRKLNAAAATVVKEAG
jgi:hypothetical protein